MNVARHRHVFDNVAEFYQSSVVIDTFNAGFAGRWHTRIVPDADGPKTSEDYVAALLELRAHHHLLDFGCGVGLVAASLSQKTGCRVRGLNVSSKQVAHAHGIANQLGLADKVVFDLYAGDRLPYPDESFDRIAFFESVCHVPNKPALFKDLWRVLRPGGILAGQDWLVTRSDLAQEEYDEWICPIEASCEVGLNTLDEYRLMLKDAGFIDVAAIDARDIYAGMAAAFTRPSGQPTNVAPTDDFATRLAKGNVALSNAFQRGLFTIGFVRGKKADRSRPRGGIRPDGSDAETGTIDCLAAGKNVAVIERHVDLFHVERSAELQSFVNLVRTAPFASSEVSCKEEGGVRHSARFNLFFHGDPADGYRRARSYLDELGSKAPLRTDLLDAFMGPDLDFARIDKVVTGLDLRTAAGASRAKIWFMLRDYPQRVERALSLAHDDGRVRSLLLHLPFLVGFDFYFDGNARIKLYPDVRPEELADPRVLALLSTDAIAAMAQCRWTQLYFSSPGLSPVLQLHPREPDVFVRRYLAVDLAKPIHAPYAGAPLLDMVVSFNHDALGQLPIRNFAVYYMPRGDVPVVASDGA